MKKLSTLDEFLLWLGWLATGFVALRPLSWGDTEENHYYSAILVILWVVFGDMLGLWKIRGQGKNIKKELKALYDAFAKDSRLKTWRK